MKKGINMNKDNYINKLLTLSTQEMIKECIELHDAVINLQSIKEKYEEVLEQLNGKINKVETPDFLDSKTMIYETTITLPTYRFAYKSEKDYIQGIITKALIYGNDKHFIEDNAVMMYGKKVIVLEDSK
jgi:hypothetical protein